MAKSVKGVRINALAKELNVDSKAILEKLRAEGMGDAAPNHMSTIPLGLAETIKDWFHAGGGGTAIETAAPVDLATAVKPKTTRKRTTKKAAASTDQAAPAAAEAPSSPAEAAPPAPTAPSVAPVEPDASTTPARPSKSVKAAVKPTIQATVAAPPELTTPAVPEPPPVAPPSKSEAAPKAPAPAAEAPKPPSPPPPAPPAPAAHGSQGPSRSFSPAAPPLRPTVTLATRAPITPAPKLETLKPAQIQGPKIVRVEQPEVVATPRPRRPVTGEPVPAFTTARPQGGRGVRKSDEELDEIELKKGGSGKKGAGSLSARRRGVDGRRGEALEKLKEFTEADRYEREERLRAATASRATLDSHLKKSQARGTHAVAKTTIEKGQPITIEEPITVKSLSAALGVKASDIIGKLIKQGIFATINQSLDVDHAQALALEYGLELKVASRATLEEQLIAEFNSRRPDPSKLVPRPPVVTILGHVDHGKTSLLDRIRSANVAAQEAGGITQHTAAWMVTVGEKDRRKQVTFIDTPGHQAFTAMRARGANMTDVVVLVVGAVEGVMPQTIESINHARAAGVPIVVALSKTDRPDANPEMVLGQLAQHDLNPVEWGGQTEVIRTSAVTGQGINELIEILDLQAEILELKTDPTAPARGTVIEARIDPGLGPVATVLVQDGTLRVGDIVLAGSAFGRIRSILNDLGKPVSQATASMPVIISGLTGVPPAGEKFYVVNDLERARAIAAEREARSRQEQLAQQNRATAGSLLEQIAAGDVKTINLIIKADVQGSVETLVATVGAQNTEEVKVKVIHAGVGAITESDVQLAIATKAKPTDNRVSIIGFHVVPEEAARILAEQHHVEIKLYRVIYEIFDDLKKALSGMLTKEVREKLHGHAEVRQVFRVSRLGNIAGCFITDGHVQRGSKVRLIRDGRVVAEDIAIESLRRVKDDVKEVKTGFECGIKLAGYDDIKQGDRFEFYVREEFERTL